MAIYIKRYNGSAWVDAVVKKWTGSAWATPTAYRWSGSSWIQIYPETAITTTKTFAGGSNTYSYRANIWKNWKKEDAKQGDGTPYASDADTKHYGFLDLSSKLFTGYGNINHLSSASFTGTRNGSGSYNSDQTIRLYRCSAYPTAISPSGVCYGLFTCTTGGPGANNRMYNRSIASSTLGNCMDWLNGEGGRSNLFIMGTSDHAYLGITGSSEFTASYTYMAKVATYTAFDTHPITALNLAPSSMHSMYSAPDPAPSSAYHSMVIYPEEENMTLAEVLQHREKNNLEDISMDTVDKDYTPRPMIREATVDNDKITTKIEYLIDGHIPEFSIDGTNYIKMSSAKMDIYDGYYNDPDFNPYTNNIYIRVRNEKTDTIDASRIREPLIHVL